MSTRPERSMVERPNAAQVAVSNALADTQIQDCLAGFGYISDKLNEGKTLLDTATAAVRAQEIAAGQQRTNTEQLKTAEQDAREAYQALAQVARAVFAKDKAKLTTLQLDSPMARSTAKFLQAAYALFDNATSVADIKSALGGYGYPPAKLTSERNKIVAYDSANQAQEAAKGAAQQATQVQEAAMQALDAWMAQFVKIAKVALRAQKQLLEKLGILARTTRTAAQSAAPAKAAARRAAQKQ